MACCAPATCPKKPNRFPKFPGNLCVGPYVPASEACAFAVEMYIFQRKFRGETSELRTVEKWCRRVSEVKELVKSKS